MKLFVFVRNFADLRERFFIRFQVLVDLFLILVGLLKTFWSSQALKLVIVLPFLLSRQAPFRVFSFISSSMLFVHWRSLLSLFLFRFDFQVP